MGYASHGPEVAGARGVRRPVLFRLRRHNMSIKPFRFVVWCLLLVGVAGCARPGEMAYKVRELARSGDMTLNDAAACMVLE